MRATHLAAPAPAAVFVQALLWGALLLFYSGDAAAPADGADPPQVLALTETDGAAALPAFVACPPGTFANPAHFLDLLSGVDGGAHSDTAHDKKGSEYPSAKPPYVQRVHVPCVPCSPAKACGRAASGGGYDGVMQACTVRSDTVCRPATTTIRALTQQLPQPLQQQPPDVPNRQTSDDAEGEGAAGMSATAAANGVTTEEEVDSEVEEYAEDALFE